MTEEKFELMEQWHTVMGLFNIHIDNIYNDYDEDETDFYYVMDTISKIEKWKADPSDAVKAVMRSMEMGVSPEDIDEYYNELEMRREEEIRRKREEEIYNNPCIIQLRDSNMFVFLENQKQYPDHTHYQFETNNNVTVTGRIFRYSYWNFRNWLSWYDENGKLVKHKWDLPSIQPPKAFPQEWREWSVTTDRKRMAQVIAYHVINKTLPKGSFGGTFKYPKK